MEGLSNPALSRRGKSSCPWCSPLHAMSNQSQVQVCTCTWQVGVCSIDIGRCLRRIGIATGRNEKKKRGPRK